MLKLEDGDFVGSKGSVPFSPSALSAMRMIVEKGKQHNKKVTLCGELGGRPLEAMGLVGIGMTSMSMVPSGMAP
jgi:phosphotransferase system, enzyme I, PtsP